MFKFMFSGTALITGAVIVGVLLLAAHLSNQQENALAACQLVQSADTCIHSLR